MKILLTSEEYYKYKSEFISESNINRTSLFKEILFRFPYGQTIEELLKQGNVIAYLFILSL
jgi:hypothetical protein